MATKEQSRIQVLNGVMDGKVTVAVASGLMGVSERHAGSLVGAKSRLANYQGRPTAELRKAMYLDSTRHESA